MKVLMIFFLLTQSAFSFEVSGSAQVMQECRTLKSSAAEVDYFSTAANAVIPAGVTDSNVIAQMQKDKTTLITFYGDSRMDNVDLPSQGNSTMDKILNTGNSDRWAESC